MSSRRNETAERAVMVLATAWVLLCGAAASAFLILNGSSTPTQTLLTFGGCAAGGGIVLWLLRDRQPGMPRASIFSWFRRKKEQTSHYKLALRKTARDPHEPPPAPPTAERVRQLKEEGLGTWVPSHIPEGKRPKQ